MGTLKLLSILLFLTSATALETADATLDKTSTKSFDKTFSFGVSTAAIQVEGAWNEDGKGESIWDYFAHHNSSRFVDGATPDEACDSYHKWIEDVEMLKDLKVTHYRFSISWPRLLPTGFENKINVKAVMYYQKLLAELKKNNIKSMVTLYHWDLPMALQDLGGWTNPKIVEYFKNYVTIAAKYFKDVDYWITINEPNQICSWGYGEGTFAPFVNGSGRMNYICAYNLLKAHAEAYHLLKKAQPNAKVSMAINLPWAEPYTNVKSDQDAAERYREFEFGIYAHPIFLEGWPSVVSQRIKERSEKEKLNSRLPQFTKQEKQFISGTADFIGVNYYSTVLVSETKEDTDYSTTSYHKDLGVETRRDDAWELGYGGTTIVPDGLYELLIWLKSKYGKRDIIITENGLADSEEGLNDTQREYFLVNHLNSVWRAINLMDVNVVGYTFWSLMDNFEWTRGYSARYGLYSVNFTDPERPRTPKSSVELYRSIITDRVLPTLPERIFSTTTQPPTTQHSSAATIKSPTLVLTVFLFIYKMFILA